MKAPHYSKPEWIGHCLSLVIIKEKRDIEDHLEGELRKMLRRLDLILGDEEQLPPPPEEIWI